MIKKENRYKTRTKENIIREILAIKVPMTNHEVSGWPCEDPLVLAQETSRNMFFS